MKFKHLILASLAIAGAMTVTSCNDDDTYDVVGNPENLVFADDNSTTASVVQIPGSTIQSFSWQTGARCNKTAKQDVLVTFTVDNSLIADYNAEHGTEFLALPEGVLVQDTPQVTIEQGHTSSTEKFSLSFVDDADALATISDEKGYLIPVRIESIVGGEKASSVKSISYIKVTVMHSVIDPDATRNNRNGSLLDDRSGWSIVSSSGEISGDLNQWFDGNNRNHAQLKNGEVVIDMGKEYSFDGVTASYYQVYWGSWGWDNASFYNTYLYVSKDGNEWTSLGFIEPEDGWNALDFVGFYGPVTGRYLKVRMENDTFDCGDLNIYAIQ